MTATAPPLTIVEFLTARLDDWEALVRKAMEPDWSGERPTFYGDGTEGAYRDDWGLSTFHVLPERILRDIAAKRAIIADCRKALDETSREVSVQAIWLAGRTLLKMAEPYASHGDYDPERWAGERPAAWDEWVFNG